MPFLIYQLIISQSLHKEVYLLCVHGLSHVPCTVCELVCKLIYEVPFFGSLAR
ncbi:unnamed protein product [Spirodela intermedia]|uniref:Uncharacterized protein n=1 Tax=Spirodela intermedia TaxID=51605 RepID=A0A7I8KZQ6_SPIIN|nr:unnamed protein product [Spirodela intermedia]